jgi:hypothetical protein
MEVPRKEMLLGLSEFGDDSGETRGPSPVKSRNMGLRSRVLSEY